MLQNTFHFVCRHYEGSYSEISVIRFVVPVCFASGLLHFTVYAWDPMDSDRLLRPFLRSCHENDIKVQHTILGHQKDGCTWGYRALAFISILARTDCHVDLGAITLPPMEHGFVEEVQLVLNDMVAREHDIIDQEIQGIAGSLFSVSKWEKLTLAQVLHCHNETKVVWTQVRVTGRLKQQRVPVRWVLPPHTELQAPLKHLRKEQTPEMLPSDDDNIPADSLQGVVIVHICSGW